MIDREGLYERGIFSPGHRLADPAPARPRRGRLESPVRRPVPCRLRRRRDHRARGSRLREDRRARQARLPAGPRRPAPVHQVSDDDPVASTDLTYRDIAKTIDHSLLRPELDDAFVEDGCRLAARYDVASVCVRPADVVRAQGDPRRHGRRGRHDHRLPARQPPDRDQGVRGRARARRRRDRAGHGHPDRRAQVRPRRRRPGGHRGRSSRSPTPPAPSSRSSSRTPT